MNHNREMIVNAAALAATMVAATLVWVTVHDRGVERLAPGHVTVVDNWRQYADSGARIGPPSATVTITLFSDYTCPHCKDAMEALTQLLRERPEHIALVVRHFPLSNGLARDAAIAAECSRRAGAFERFHQTVFKHLDSLGSESWAFLAFAAGVPDTISFVSCMADSTAMATVGRDLRAAYRLGVSRTPAFLINDRFFEGNPPRQFLRAVVEDRFRSAAAAKRRR